MTDAPHRLDFLGNICNGSLVCEHLMDAIHVGPVIRDALRFEFYVQLPDMAPIEGTHVSEPLDYREETATICDVELEAVLLEEETKSLIPYLPACAKQA